MKLYLRLLGFTRPLRGFLAPYMISSVLSVAFGLINFTLLIPLLNVLFGKEQVGPIVKPAPTLSVDYLIDSFNYYFALTMAERGKMQALYLVCAILIVSVLFSNVFRYFIEVLVEGMRADFTKRLRERVFTHILRLHLGYFSEARKGDVMSRLTTDVFEVESSVSETIVVLFKEPLTLLAYIYAMIHISGSLTLFALVVIPLSGIIIGLITKRLRRQARESAAALGLLVSVVEEALSGMRIIKAFNAVPYFEGKFEAQTSRYASIYKSMARRREISPPFSEFSGVLVVCAILIYGGGLVLSGDASLPASAFITYLAIFSQVLRPAKQISQAFSKVQKGLASAERIFAVLDAEPQLVSPANGRVCTGLGAGLRLDDVSFGYEQGQTVLDRLSLDIPTGQSIALVGPSGGGKSTIADLLLRFYEPTGGTILLDGYPLQEYDMETVRSFIGLVSQESVLFNDTIFNNIAFCKPSASKAEVEQAARVANAHSFILDMPLGYDTPIGDRGLRLSGGQRQRLSIARAVLQNPQLLILDEATSALDTESERLVQDALQNLLVGRTSLIIAHRLSTIKDADRIVVLERGRIREQGTHDELLAVDNGLYARLAGMQEN